MALSKKEHIIHIKCDRCNVEETWPISAFRVHTEYGLSTFICIPVSIQCPCCLDVCRVFVRKPDE